MKDYKHYVVEHDVMTPAEVGELLGVSRQQVSNLVSRGKLPVAKSVPGCTLFLRDDVEEYLINRKKINIISPKDIFSGSTHRCIDYVRSLPTPSSIGAVFLFFNPEDAINAGFYTTSEVAKKDVLSEIRAPQCVLKYDDLTEVWIHGITCGYTGTGPNGAYHMLTEILGVAPRLAEAVYQFKKINYIRDFPEWICSADDGLYPSVQEQLDQMPLGDLAAYYLFNGNIVVLRNHVQVQWLYDEAAQFVQSQLAFAGTPSSVTLMDRETCYETGHFIASTAGDKIYPVIVKGTSGREVWLDINVNENISLTEQQTVMDLLAQFDIRFPDNEVGKLPNFLAQFFKRPVYLKKSISFDKEADKWKRS